MQGLISMLAFFYVVAALPDKVGFPMALLLAASMSLALQAVIVYTKRSYNRSHLAV